MSRATILLAVPVLAAGLILAGAGPASAATSSPDANCVGATASFFNSIGHVDIGLNGLGGQLTAYSAQQGGVGRFAPHCTIV